MMGSGVDLMNTGHIFTGIKNYKQSYKSLCQSRKNILPSMMEWTFVVFFLLQWHEIQKCRNPIFMFFAPGFFAIQKCRRNLCIH
jgi:hypothetical protein